MFKSFQCTFLNIFQAILPVKYKSMKDKNNWVTQGIKLPANTKAVCKPSLGTAMIEKQKHNILNTV
jgi:hypothetical protein